MTMLVASALERDGEGLRGRVHCVNAEAPAAKFLGAYLAEFLSHW